MSRTRFSSIKRIKPFLEDACIELLFLIFALILLLLVACNNIQPPAISQIAPIDNEPWNISKNQPDNSIISINTAPPMILPTPTQVVITLHEAQKVKNLLLLNVIFANEETDGVISVSWSPDSTMLATGGWDKVVSVWKISEGERIRLLEGHKYAVTSVAWSPDGKYLASGSSGGTVIIWDTSNGEQVRQILHPTGVKDIKWRPNGSMLAVLIEGETAVWLWNIPGGDLIRNIETGRMNCMELISGWKNLLTGNSMGMLWSWDAQTGELLWRQSGGKMKAILSMEWSPTAQRVAQASIDNNVWLSYWISAGGQRLRGHEAPVRDVDWSSNGQMLVSGSDDETVRIWDEASGEQIAILEGHTGAITSVSWSPDERLLASGSSDGTVRLWGVSP